MKFKTNLAFVIAIFLCICSHSQTPVPKTPKTLAAKRTAQTVKIDGLLSDSAWKDAALATGLIEFRPKAGAPEETSTRSETYLMYNNEGIYFGGYLYERNKDSISTELRGRDGFGNNDFIGIIFDTYKDHQNGFEYFITPLNEQMDAKQSPNTNGESEDFSWNAVWESAAVIHADGWSFEMFIPYSAIRFGSKNVQDWGLNITRRRQKTGQQYMWNPVDPNVNGFLTQEGYWTGITNIKSPLRLQFSPYFSTYANHYPANVPGVNNWTSQVNGGMDVKYGITPAFTLDATLIPDFGQVQSDNQVLNLTPFDIQFNENRAFFTEGTELFSKGGLFYSRRIGVESAYQQGFSLQPGEEVIKNPRESKLINATKVSGRTQKGLGIGLLNAITKTRYATIENTTTNEKHEVETEPLTNYNVLVLDQTLKNNSSVSLVNTNVWRSGSAYDANVTAGLFSFNDKKNMWNVGGKAAVSNQVGYEAPGKTLTGYSQSLYFGKTSGRLTFNVYQDITDTKYTHSDLGFFTNNNFLDHGGFIGYRWTEPKSWYNRIFININTRYSRLLTAKEPIDQLYQTANLNVNLNIQSKKLWWVGGFLGLTFRENDFYEPRWDGWFFRRNASLGFGGWFESNFAKKYSFYTELFGRRVFKFYNGLGIDYFLQQSYRFNNKFSLTHRISLQPRFNNIGYAYSDNNTEITFARRKRSTVENVLSTKYSFTNRMGLTFRLRHYFSSVDNKEFFTLRPDGKLDPNPLFNKNVDRNLNIFNIDMVYTWQFAPGSFLNLVWKSSAFDSDNLVEKSYFKNFSNTLETDQNNNLSMKVIYFLDYLQLKKKKKKKTV